MMSPQAIDARQSPDECLASGEYPLTRRDLAEIAAMIYADAGIYLNETKASLVYSRLSKHIRNLGLKGFRDYCNLVSSPAGAAARAEALSSGVALRCAPVHVNSRTDSASISVPAPGAVGAR